MTVGEIEMLMEGLDVLPNKNAPGEMMIGLLDTMMAKDKEGAERALAKREAKAKTQEAERKQLCDRVVLLKAKLIKMKDGVLVDAAMKGGE